MVSLRILSLDDKHEIARLLNNKNVWDNLRDYIPYPYSIQDAESYISMTAEQVPQTYFAITFEGEFCGVVGLVLKSDVYLGTAEIGYWLGEEYWGKGIMKKAVELITDYGFQKLDLNRIDTGIFDFNIGSMKVLERNGYVKEGIFKNAVVKNNKICDEHRYSKLNPSKFQ